MQYSKEKENRISYYLPYLITTAVFSLPALTGGLLWLYFLTPLPVMFYLLTLGPAEGPKVVYRAAIISGIFAIAAKVFPVLLFSMTLVPVGFILASGIKSREEPYLAALKGICFLTVIWLLGGLAVSSAHHINLYNEILVNIDRGLAAAFESYKASAAIPPATIIEVEIAFTELRQVVPKLFPGTVLMTIISTVWLNVLLGDWLLKKRRPDLSCWGKFRTWRLPEQLVWGGILAAVMTFIPGGLIKIIGLNGLMVFGLIYFFQGLAVISFLLTKWAVPKPIKIFLFVILAVQAYGMIVLAVLGLTDVWFDFRRPRPAVDDEPDI